VSTPVIVVLTIAISTALLLVVFMIALFRQLKELAATLRQYRGEVQPLLDEIQRASETARTRAENVPSRLPARGAGARLRKSS
jgi:predicted PurR-regulated permease PerM